MPTRLQDLISTADKQLASRAYDAAIDTYRTALGEPGAVEEGVAGRLDAACRARDAARGVAPSAEPPTPSITAPAPAPFAEPPAPSIMETVVAPPARPAEPEPAPLDDGPIEPPAFHLIEDDPSILERPHREHSAEFERPLSILDPAPLPEEPDGMALARIAVAALITLIVCGALFYASFGKSGTPRSSRGSGVTSPVLQFKTEPEYTAEARQARIQGTVMLDVEIEPDGTATVLGVLKSLDPGLDQRAIEAVGKWRFRPGMKDGRPVKTTARVAVNFRLL